GVAASEAGTEFFQPRGQQEDIAMGAADSFIWAGAELRGALYVEVEQDILPALKIGQHFAFESAVTVTEDDGVFEETTGFDLGEEFCFGEKVVVASVDFAGTGRAGGGGDAVMPRTIRGSGATQGGLAASGGAGNNAEQAWQSGHRRWSHS